MSLNITTRDIEIVNFDESFASATRTLFTQNGLDAIFSIPGDGEQAQEVSGEVLFETGASSNKGFVDGYPSSEAGTDDYYQGTLTVNIRSQRTNMQSPAIDTNILTRHNEICSTIRAILEIRRNPYDGVFTYYAVKFIRPVSTRHFTEWDFMQDVSTLVFQVEWAVLPTAWQPS